MSRSHACWSRQFPAIDVAAPFLQYLDVVVVHTHVTIGVRGHLGSISDVQNQK
jgi:hypothetical protein